MPCWKSLWLIPLLAAAIWLPTGSVQAQIFSGSSQSRMMGRAGQGPNYFAIMGHVKYPQTYLLPTSAPSLVDFIRFAGGALESTTGEVRIVRAGRVVQQTMLSQNSTIKLMPGDLVILDGGRTGRGNIFRGGNNSVTGNAESTRLNQVCLVGILPYPIIMQMTADVVTKRWIVRQLGQNESIIDAVKVVERRNFAGNSGPDVRLSDNSILTFPEGVIDQLHLPELPRPFRAGTDRHPDQKPHAALPRNQDEGSAAAEIPFPVTRPLPVEQPDTQPDVTAPADSVTPPGYSGVPDARESAGAIGPDPDAARNLLTHPGSVALDEKPTTLPGRARLSDSGTATTGRPRQDSAGPAPAATAPRAGGDSEIRFNADVVAEAEAASSPLAETPFRSQPDPDLTPVRPEGAPRSPETSALPLTPIVPGGSDVETPRAVLPAPPVQLLDPPQESPSNPAPIGTPANSNPQVSSEPQADSQGPSMALNGAAGFAKPPGTVEIPSAEIRLPLETTQLPRLPDSVGGGSPKFTEASIQSLPRRADNLPEGEDVSVVGKPRIIPREKSASRWPLITAGVIGSLGFLAAFSLLLSMTGPPPVTPAPAAKSDRYWLDKIINDELPVSEEPAAEPVVTQLFGRPTNAPTLRLDAGHSEIPRPHFLDRGRQSGVGQQRSPRPDIPQPDSKRPDRETEDGPDTIPPRRSTSPRRGPDVPLAPAAEEHSAGTAVSERPAAVPKPKQRIVRIDTGHDPADPAKQPADRQPTAKTQSATERSTTDSSQKIVVKPAASVVAGSDLLDRILASVESEKARATKQQPAKNPTSHKDPS